MLFDKVNFMRTVKPPVICECNTHVFNMETLRSLEFIPILVIEIIDALATDESV